MIWPPSPVHASTLLELFQAGRPIDGAARLLSLPGGSSVSYDDVDRQSAQLAHALAGAGVGPGDRVAVQVDKSVASVALYVACLRCGAIFLPVNPAYGADELAYLLADAAPRVVVLDPDREPAAVDPEMVRTLDGAGAGTLADAAAGQPDTFDAAPLTGADPAALLYTSGTTGRPKGALLSHANLAANAATLVGAWGFGPDDVLLHVLPTFHAHGLFVAVHCVLASGASMVFLPTFDVDQTLAAMSDATVFMGVPTHYTRLLDDERLDRRRCRDMRLFVSGSAPLSVATHEAFRARTGHTILERYGMTETVMLASNPLDGERRAGTVGKPLPGVQIRISAAATAPLDGSDVDSSTGQGGPAVGVGPVGAVEVRGPSVFGGYWNRPELTATEFNPDGWFRTGDLGCFDVDGYLHLVGRSKDVVITGGLNVYPKEVERVLDALPGVDESAVIGVPDGDFGEAVVAVVVPVAGGSVDPAEVRAAARLHLAAFKVPKRVHVVPTLPRNAMGKVQKAELRATFGPAAFRAAPTDE